MTGSRFAGLIALGLGVCLLVGERAVHSQVVLDDRECKARQCEACSDYSPTGSGYCVLETKSFNGCLPETGEKCTWISEHVHCPGMSYSGGSCANQTGKLDDFPCAQISAQCIP